MRRRLPADDGLRRRRRSLRRQTRDDADGTLETLEHAEPGRRFQTIYDKRQGAPHAKAKNGAFLIGGVLVLALGLATYPVPVIPSEIVIVVGLALLAQGSRRGAIILDGAEVRLRRWFAPAIRVWHRLPRWGKAVTGTAWTLAIGGLSYWAWRALHG